MSTEIFEILCRYIAGHLKLFKEGNKVSSIVGLGLPILYLTKTKKVREEKDKGIRNSEAIFKDIPGEKDITLTTRGAEKIEVKMDKELNSVLFIINEYSKKGTMEYIVIYWLETGTAHFYGVSFDIDRDAGKVFKHYFKALEKGKYIEGKIEGEKAKEKEYLEFLKKIEIK